MSEVITKLKVKQLDGNFGQEIPVGAKAQNVYFDQKLSTETNNILGRVNASLSLDTLTKNLQDKLITFQEKKGNNSAISDGVWSSALDSNKILVTNENGEIAASSVAATSLSAINTIGDKQNANLGSGNANKVLVTNGSSNITVSNNTTAQDLEKIAGIGGTNGISSTLLQTLNDKQPKIGDNSALTGSGTNIWTNKLASKNKVLISDANGTITTSDITTNQLNSLANLNTLLGQKADTTTTNNALNNTITVNQTTGTEVKLDFNTLGGTTVSKSITAASSSQNGVMTKAQYDNLYSLRNLYNRTVANNLTTETSGTAVLDAQRGWFLYKYGFYNRGVRKVASEFIDDTYITYLQPGAYEIFFKAGEEGNTTKGINQVVPQHLPTAMGTLLISWTNYDGEYKSFIFISNNGRMYIRHASEHSWHYAWTQINPAPANTLTSNATDQPLAAQQGQVLNGKISSLQTTVNSIGTTVKVNTATTTITNTRTLATYHCISKPLTLTKGVWVVTGNIRNISNNYSFVANLRKKGSKSPDPGDYYTLDTDIGSTNLLVLTVNNKINKCEGRTNFSEIITVNDNSASYYLWANYPDASVNAGTVYSGMTAVKIK